MHRLLKSVSSLKLVAAYIMGILAALSVAKPAFSQDKAAHAPEAQSFVHGAPSDPSETWTLAAGGRIYDNWWDALDRKKPQTTHPSYPKTKGGDAPIPNSWRCKECHGWDYKGRDGEYASGEHATGIKGIRGAAGRSPAAIFSLLRAPLHGYTKEMINDEELRRVAMFVSKGQHDVDRLKDKKGMPAGNISRGRELYQTTCAACHGFDGKLLNWGTKEDPAYIGSDSNKFPWEVLHKIRNSHTGVAMISMRALPISDAAAILAYARTLPQR